MLKRLVSAPTEMTSKIKNEPPRSAEKSGLVVELEDMFNVGFSNERHTSLC